MMKKILGIALLMMMVSVSIASEISFSPDTWDLGKWCIIATDIIVDTKGQQIAATDIMIESSLEFVNFVPSPLFPFFFPPKVRENVLHLVWFSTDATNRMTGSGSIWTLYMKQKDTTSTDGSLKLYFTAKWDTTDTNLSIAWWVDTLETVKDAYYTFWGITACEHTAADIKWWIATMTVQDIAKQVNGDYGTNNIFTRKTLLIVGGVLILSILLFVYYRKNKQWEKA